MKGVEAAISASRAANSALFYVVKISSDVRGPIDCI